MSIRRENFTFFNAQGSSVGLHDWRSMKKRKDLASLLIACTTACCGVKTISEALIE